MTAARLVATLSSLTRTAQQVPCTQIDQNGTPPPPCPASFCIGSQFWPRTEPCVGLQAEEPEHDVHFESADAGASLTYPQQAGTIRKGAFIVIKNRPCKVRLQLN